MITLIFCGDLRYCPYLKRYTERLEKANVDYEVLFWNRAGLSLDVPPNYHYYDRSSAESLGKIKKIKDFFGFKVWVFKHLEISKPHGLIMLSTLTGILLYEKTKKIPYVFDIRDYSYENIGVFKELEERIIRLSSFTCISSKGFKAFLPEYPYIIAHNFNRSEIPEVREFKKKNYPLKIVWNGTVRFFEYQKNYIDLFKNDDRFLLIYHGTGLELEQYKAYCVSKQVKNVIFTGAYDNSNKKKLLIDAAILNNCYGGRSGDELKYAISNRFYDGIVNCIPQIVEPSGYKASVSENNHIGIALGPTQDAPDRLFTYYDAIDENEFVYSCSKLLTEIIEEDDLYIAEIDKFIRNI
ncbi:conserved hypothetical protein [uncultured Spirochaetota bacterium]|jgi:hypothetical protein|nr:conserved hypothetical protein [uncultured Spirochaetota bacterium]